MFIRGLMAGASHIALAPENDHGAEFEDDFDGQGSESYPDEGLDDEELFEGDDRRGSDTDDADEQDNDDGSEPRSEARRPVRRPNRSQERIRRLDEELRREREARERLERSLEARPATPSRPQHEIEAERRERLALMSADEKAEFFAEETRLQTRQELARIEFNSADRSDRAEFRALCREDRAVAAVAEEVEQRLADMRRRGENTDRETIATFIIGQRARAKQTEARTKAVRKRETDLDRERARPGSGARSGAERPNGKNQLNTREALRKRLANINI